MFRASPTDSTQDPRLERLLGTIKEEFFAVNQTAAALNFAAIEDRAGEGRAEGGSPALRASGLPMCRVPAATTSLSRLWSILSRNHRGATAGDPRRVDQPERGTAPFCAMSASLFPGIDLTRAWIIAAIARPFEPL